MTIELPEPEFFVTEFEFTTRYSAQQFCEEGEEPIACYTAASMAAYAAAKVAEERERCAKLSEEISDGCEIGCDICVAKAIRSQKEAGEP